MDFYGAIRGVDSHLRSAQIEQLLKALDLQAMRKTLVKHLSGGNKRKLCVAQALLGRSRLVLLDEPTSGVDPSSKRKVWKLLSAVREEAALLVSSHSMEECEVMCQRVGILVNGSMKCVGTAQQLKNRFATIACS